MDALSRFFGLYLLCLLLLIQTAFFRFIMQRKHVADVREIVGSLHKRN